MSSSIMIVRGPVGTGKSTAVLDWLRRSDEDAASWSWINLDTLDAEIASALAKDASATHDSPDAAELRRVHLLEHFERSSNPESHLLVLDMFGNKHSRELSATLELLAWEHPERRFVIITHQFLDLERKRSLSPVEIAVIPPQEFAFTVEETRAYFAGTMLAEFSEEMTVESCGSIALLRLAKLRAETMEPQRSYGGTFLPPPGAKLATKMGAYVFRLDTETRAAIEAVKAAVRRDLLLQITNDLLDPDQLQFFANLSVPSFVDERIVPRLCRDAPAHWLQDLEERGLIHRSTRNPEREFQINPVFRRVLKDTYLSPEPERLRALYLSCARFELENGSAYRALRFALEAEDYGLASEVLRNHADEYLEGELGKRGAYLLDSLPLTVLAKYPMLAISLAVAYSATGKFRFKTLELLALAATTAHALAFKAQPVDRLVMIMIESVAMRLSGFGDAAVRSARAGIRLYRGMTPEERDGIGRFEGAILVQFSLSLHSGSMGEEALEAVEYGVSAENKCRNSGRGNYACTLLAYFHALDGNIHLAKVQLRDSGPEYWLEPGINSYFASPFRLASFFCAMEEQRFDDAREWLDLLSAEEESNEFWPVIRLAESMLAIINNEATSSLVRMHGYLNRENDRPAAQKTGRQMLATAAALLSLASGDAGNAIKTTQKIASLEDRHTLQALVRLAQGDAPEALRLCASAGTPVSPRTRFVQAVVALAASLQQGNRGIDSANIRVVESLAKDFGLGLALNFLPIPDLERVLHAARNEGIKLTANGVLVSSIPGGLGRVVLSQRELAVLRELVSTGSFAEIAERQFVSVNTVKSQLRSVYKKLGVSDRSAAIDAARVQGLLEMQGPREPK